MQRSLGFTLAELVVVVAILGVLVAIALPRIVNVSGTATDNAARVSLKALRDAIAQYASQNGGEYPTDQGDDEFKEVVTPLLRGPFPKCPVGSPPGDQVTISADDPLVADNGGGWMYNGTTGRIIINCTDRSRDGITRYNEWGVVVAGVGSPSL